MSRGRARGLLILGDASGGGVGACVRDEASWFAERGWRVMLAVPPDRRGPDLDGVDARALSIPRTARDLRGMTGAVRETRRLVRQHRPDVIHAHGMRSFLVARSASARRPYVTLHGTGRLPDDPSGYGLIRSAGIGAIPWFSRRAFNAGVERYRGWQFLPHASPRLGSMSALPPPPEGEPLILWLGGLVVQKRPDLFVRAISEAARTTPVQGVMAGEGPLHQEIEALIRSLGAPVELLGRVEDVEGLLRRSSGVVLFSWFEAVTFALQEAMWAGRAVIASPLPSLRWLLGDTGIYADDIASAASAVVQLTDRDRAVALGAATAERIRSRVHPHDPWPVVETTFMRDLGESGAG